MEGERSGLFYEALRIIDELKPTWAIWENVPGLLSSDGGRDLARVMFSMVEHGYSGCYRVLDSQWFGVAQRRRRVFGVFARGDSGAERAAKVLSLTEGLRGHPAPQRETGKDTARGAAVCAEVSGTLDQTSCNARRGGQTNETSFLIAIGDPVVAFQGQASVTQGLSMSSKTSPTQDKSKTPCIAFDMSHADDPARLTGDKTNALQARMGTGGNQVPCIAIQDVIHGDKQCNGKGWNDSGVAYTLDTMATQGVCVPTSAKTWPAEVAPTLNAHFGDKQGLEDQHALNGAGLFVPTHEQPIYFEPRFVRTTGGQPKQDGIANALTIGHRGTGDAKGCVAGHKWGVRRLTPMECERLQGFPEDWAATLSDAQRYKALGNAVTVNVAEWIAKRLIKEL